jgi:hypothetical protein
MNDLTPETDFAERIGIPIKQIRHWRKTGDLQEDIHWLRVGQVYHLTEEGIEQVRGMIHFDNHIDLEPDPGPDLPTIPLKVARNQGLNPRLLRCLLIDPIEGIGPRVAVRLITPRVATRHFKPGTTIEATPTDTPDIFEYHGPKPRTIRI